MRPFAATRADASTQLAAVWIRDHDLEAALPNAPHITAGPLIALEPEREARP